MSWVLVKVEDGSFVADTDAPGQRSSYTRDLTRARVYASEEAADRDRCTNERAVRFEALARRPR